MPEYDFDTFIERKGSSCIKHDMLSTFFGAEDVIPMWVADMDFASPDFVREALAERLRHPVLGYSFRDRAVLEAATEWFGRQHDWRIQTDWLLFTPGVVPGIAMALLCFTEPGDKVIIQPPVYHPFQSMIDGNGREAVHNQLILRDGRYVMDHEGLETLAADPGVKVMILCNPHNPVGRAWDAEELARVCDTCERHDVLLVSDEIHADLALPGHLHTPAMKCASDGFSRRVISTVAPSKTFNLAGMASSLFIIPDEGLRQRFDAFLRIQHLFIGNLFGNVAMEAAWRQGDDWLAQLKRYIRGNIDLVRERLARIPGIELVEPEATYLLWLDCRGLGLGDEGLRDFMIRKARLGLNDGPGFGPGGSGFQRLNVASPRSTVIEALDRLERAVLAG